MMRRVQLGSADLVDQPVLVQGKRTVRNEPVHPMLQRKEVNSMDMASANPWSRQHLPYTIVGTLLGAVALAAVLAYVIIKRRRKASSPLSPEPPKLQPAMRCPGFTIRLAPSFQQPISVLEIRRAGGCTMQSSPSGTRPLTQIGGGMVLGSVTPSSAIIPQTIRIKAKGLLERRGSNASLTIDLNPSESFHLPTSPKECSPIEYLTSAGNRLTRRHLRTCLKDTKTLHQEFLEIPLNHPGKLDLPGCSNKNRYKSIWPNEHSRVILLKSGKTVEIPENSEQMGQNMASGGAQERKDGEDASICYINANYVRGYDNEPKAYIAAQGPLANTVDDFWLMVWQERSACIVMMTRLKENNRVKCEPYLPTREAQYGEILVVVKMTTAKNGYYIRDILLRRDSELRHIKHYWFTGWPDQKAPSCMVKQLMDLVQEVGAERQKHIRNCSNGNGNVGLTGPIVVHCSAGLGRTGCFIAISVGMKQLQEENMVDILGIVCQLRLDRGGMIQTLEQYEFLHYALMHYERQLPETPTSASLPLTSSGSHSNSTPNSREGIKHDSPTF